MPKVLLSGRNETVCVSIHTSFASLPIKVIIDLKIKQTHYFTNRVMDSGTYFLPNNHYK